ncbi:syncytin-1-like [Marmota marmota marmota]|nr:syncytin-1-like [Marmota marmota marmota]
MAAELNENIGGFKQPKWVCVNKPGLVVPNPTETLGSCPATCHYTPAMHISCYTSASICVNNQGKQYFEAILTNTRGEWGTTYNYIPFLGDRGGEGITTRLTEAGCEGVVGKPSCWPMQAPIGVSDGGGPTDAIKHLQVIKLLKPEIPKPTYHPLILPKSQLPDLDANTLDILETTFSLLNSSNPTLDDVQTLSGTIKDLQDQIDSLAEVVLQNRRGLDLLTANQGGICLALGERCCFYANKSGIVRTKIKQLQEDLEKRRRELFENPLWTGLNGFLPYLLPLLGPLLGLLLVVAVGPCIVNKIVQFIKDQINILASKPIQVHYQRLKMDDRLSEIYFRPIRR